jgi:FAD/FMN-containing dehydrogenase
MQGEQGGMELSGTSLSQAKEVLAGIVGVEGYRDEEETLSEFSSDLSGWGRGDPVCIVRPHNAREVQSVVDMANLDGLNLVPVSSGPPHSRGDTVPQGEAVIMDLSAMSEVVRVDRRNKVALIEPGVTFGRLKEELERVGLKVIQPLLPRANKSIIASYLEREPITIPKYHWDVTDPLLCVEVVFGTGEIFRTGSAAGPGNLRQQWDKGLAQKNPMGPAQTDFSRIIQGSQGTMGVVTWATVKLEVLPEKQHFYFIPEKKLDKLVEFTYRAMKPKLTDEYLILNDVALACVVGKGREEIAGLTGRQSPFTCIYSVSGYEYATEKRLAFQEHDLSIHAQQCGVVIAREVPRLSGINAARLLQNPSEEPYWKTRLAGGWHDLFFLTTLDQASRFVDLVQGLAEARSFPRERLGVYIQPIQAGRSCHLEFQLFHDPTDAEDARRAGELLAEAAAACSEAGAFFSRPYGPWADLAYARCPDTVKVLRKVKEMLDPKGVMNRGKLCFKTTGEG